MDQVWKTRWLNALRSGSYVQGKNSLVVEGSRYDKFCCLGVLMDLLAQEDPKNVYYEAGAYCTPSAYGIGSLPEVSSSRLTQWAKEKVGLSDGAESMLMSLNDKGKSFKFIAEVIETGL